MISRKGDQPQGCSSWGWRGLDPWKYVSGSEYVLTPKMSHSFIQNCWTTSASFTSSSMKDLCQKWKVKLIFRGTWNSLIAWPDWPWPHILRQIYATDQPAFLCRSATAWCIKSQSENNVTWLVLTNLNPISRSAQPGLGKYYVGTFSQ